MRVLLINSVCGRQSTGRIVTDIKQKLIKQGHECVIAYGEANSVVNEDDYHIGTEKDRYIHAGLSRIFDNTGNYSKKVTIEFIQWIKKYNPDVIHLHNIHGYYINIEVLFLYLKQSKKRIIWTLHDCWSFTGHCAYFDYVNCDRWKKKCYDCPQKSEYPARWLIDNSSNNYEMKKKLFVGVNNLTIVTPSYWLKSLVKQSYLSKYETLVINNGIDITTFKPRDNDVRKKFNIGNRIIVLGVAAVWDYRKGLNTFIELNSKLNPEKYQIIIVGLRKEQVRRLPKNIIKITATDSIIELAELYSAADVFVNPTLEDNYPTTNLEAISCNTPVISYNTGGSPESASKYGYVVEKNDVNGIINAINKIDNVNREEMNVDSKQKVREYINLYQIKRV